MDLTGAAARRWTRLLARTGVEVRQFAQAVGRRSEHPSDLLIVGVPEFEPWHFTAHLAEQASRFGRQDLNPTLLRWHVPDGAPGHLAVPVDSLHTVHRHQTVLAIDPFGGDPELLERIDHAHRRGARILSLHRGHPELMDLSHETLSVDRQRPDQEFEVAQHLVTDLSPIPAHRGLPRPAGV
jgi:hypothetical protein